MAKSTAGTFELENVIRSHKVCWNEICTLQCHVKVTVTSALSACPKPSALTRCELALTTCAITLPR